MTKYLNTSRPDRPGDVYPADSYGGGFESRLMREHRQAKQRESQARLELQVRRMRQITESARRRELERIEGEEQARRDLERHAKRLADEVERARARNEANPWLAPWDPGYVSPTELRIRQAAEGTRTRAARPESAAAMAARMQATVTQIRSRAPRPAGSRSTSGAVEQRRPSAGRTVAETLRRMTESEAARFGPEVVFARQRALAGATMIRAYLPGSATPPETYGG